MRKLSSVCLLIGGLLCGGVALANDSEKSSAEKGERLERDHRFQYAIKFVCGRGDGEVLAKGTYYTAINVHNPTFGHIKVQKKFAVALPSEDQGPISPFFKAKLGPDGAFEIDCPDIVAHIRYEAPFLKGFAVIFSLVKLDIVAVYTVAGENGYIESLDIERVEPSEMMPPPTVITDIGDACRQQACTFSPLSECCPDANGKVGDGCCCQTGGDCRPGYECLRWHVPPPDFMATCHPSNRPTLASPWLESTQPPMCQW